MHFLDVGALIARNCDDVIGRTTLQPLFPAQRDRNRALFLCRLESAQHVLGASARRDSNDDVAALGESLDLALEQCAISKVVGDTGDDPRIPYKRDRGQRSPRLLETADQLFDEMACLSGAASVAKGENLPASADARQQGGTGSV